MTRFHINTDDLEVTVAALSSMATLCERLLAEVDSLAVSASAEWTGEANEQFLALKAAWADGARVMSEGVQVIHQAATESNANYLAVAEAAARVWR